MDMEVHPISGALEHQLFLGIDYHFLVGMGLGNPISMAKRAINFSQGLLVGWLLYVFQLLHLRHSDKRGIQGFGNPLWQARNYRKKSGSGRFNGMACLASVVRLFYSTGFCSMVYPCYATSVSNSVEVSPGAP